MTIRRLALAAAAMAAAWMFALSLPVYADSHEESETTEEAAEKEHEEKEEAREEEHENGDAHEEAEHEHGDSDEEAEHEHGDSDEEAEHEHGDWHDEEKRDRVRSPEAIRERMGSLLHDFYGREDEDDMRRRGEMVEAIRERMEALRRRYGRGDEDDDMRGPDENYYEAVRERIAALRRIPAEQLRERLIEQTKRAMREKIEKSPEDGHEIELGGEKRIREIEEMSEEKLRAVFMKQMQERLKSMRETETPNRMGAMMSMRKNRMGGETGLWNMRRRVNINRMNRRTDSGEMRFEAFHLEHIPAQHAAEMVDPFMPRNARIAADPRSNKLLVMTSGEGMRIAMAVLQEVDIPVRGEREAMEEQRRQRQREADEAEENRRRRRPEEETERDEGDRRSGALQTPMYDYERPWRFEPRDPAGVWALGGDIFNPYMPANRIEGLLTEKGEDYIAVQIEGVGEEMRARLPVVRVGDGWMVKGNLANKIKELDPGDAVIFEWWEAEGVLYLQDIARVEEKRRERIETYLFE